MPAHSCRFYPEDIVQLSQEKPLEVAQHQWDKLRTNFGEATWRDKWKVEKVEPIEPGKQLLSLIQIGRSKARWRNANSQWFVLVGTTTPSPTLLERILDALGE